MTSTAHSGRTPAEAPQSRLEGILARVEDDLREHVGSIRLPEFVLMAFVVAVGTQASFVPGQLPLGYVAIGSLCVVGAFRRPLMTLHPLSWLPLAFGALVLYVVAVSVLSPVVSTDEWTRRVGRLALVLTVMFFFASRRLDIVSGIKGLTAGMLVNVALFYAGVAPDNYDGYLTGYWGDKNQAGLAHAVIGLLLLAFCRTRRIQTLVIVGSVVFLWLTGSRTSMAAFAFGLLWILFSSRLGNFFRTAVAGFVVWAVQYLEDNFARAGVFASRAGSDALRERINEAAGVKISQTPFQGQGYGQAFAWVEGEDWFFHNAYDTLYVEGGWLYLLAVVGLTVVIGLRPVRRRPPTRLSLVAEGATLALLICAGQLGEVFFTWAWAVVMAMAVTSRLDRPFADEAQKPGTVPRMLGVTTS